MSILLQITQGFSSLVDDADLLLLAGHGWCAHKTKNKVYAKANIKIDGVWRRVFMHRFITQAKIGEFVDHRDGDGLNNTRQNLRLATQSRNLHNTGGHRTKKTSQFKGVSWSKSAKKWHAQIMVDRKYSNLGYFDSELDAAKAYDEASQCLVGEFSKPNFMEAA